MRCTQSGCEITVDTLMEVGKVPANCLTCGHPLSFVLERDEAADLFGIPLEATADTTQDPLIDNEE